MEQILSKIIPEKLRTQWKNKSKRENTSILLSGATSAFIIKLIGAALNFATQIVLARLLGVQEYGFFAYATSWMIILSIPAQLGLSESLIRFIPEYEATNQPGHIKGILRFANRASFLAAMLITVMFTIAMTLKSEFWAEGQIAVFWVMIFVLPIFTLNRIRESALRAFRRIAKAFIPEYIFRLILLCIMSATIYLLSDKLLAWQAWICNMIAYGCAFILGSWWLSRALPKNANSVAPKQTPGKWLLISLPMFMMAGMNVILNQSGVVMLGFFVSPADVGIYSVCARIVILINFALTSVNAIAGPLISKLYHSNQIEELQKILTLAARGIFCITLLAVAFLTLLGNHILYLFGPDFVRGYGPLLILVLGQMINAFAGSVALIMNMTGHQNNTAKILGVSAVVNLCINLVLVPSYGAYGAAIATTSSIIIWNGLMLIYVRRNIGLNPTIIV